MSSLVIHVLDPRLPGIARLDSYNPCRFLADLGDAMDFITDLPTVRAKNSILVVVDRLTKMAHFTPCSKSITVEKTAQLILDGIVRLHGLPEEIVSDRGPQFASKFWRRLFELLGVDIRLSSAFHPETDGQTERTNQTFEQYLRCTVNYQ
jgi:transposase InsO family protein